MRCFDLRYLAAAALALCAVARPVAAPADPAPPPPSVMESLYRDGVLPSGRPLRGERAGGRALSGMDAACVNCHRRSGLGASEGQIVVPPITGEYLFRPRGGANEDMDYRYARGYINLKHQSYTDATLAEAIRHGVGRDGHPLDVLMPRFDLDDATMTQLIGYLRGLSNKPSPGVTADTLHFATIVTPDADPAGRDAMLAVLRQFFADKNAFIKGGARPMRADRNMFYRVTRRWRLHVWQLEGAPDTWEAQLRRKLAAEPVFAVISGIGGKTWAPVHRFCQREALPCLFPNVDLPVVNERDFYSVYYSRGVLLEGDLMAQRFAGDDHPPRRVVQIFRRGDIGEDAARHLDDAARAAGRPVPVDRPLGGGDARRALAEALRQAGAGDALVLWLRPADLALLPDRPVAAPVFISGLMGGLDKAPLPPAWRKTAELTWPYELPALRRVAMDFPLGWFRVRRIPVTDERVQVNTYLACQILSETLTDMLDLFYRDYLVEQMENMLSRRLVNGYFPRLGLAPGQRFASKGGYLVKLADGTANRVAADGEWTVP